MTQAYTIEAFYSGSADLIKKVNDFAQQYNLVDIAKADHICFKCESPKVFEEIRAMLEPEADFLHQSYISKRRIAIIKLKRVFETNFGPITTLELSDQKPDGSQKTGFDHIEIFPVNTDYGTFTQKIEGAGAPMEKIERPHHTTYDIDLEDGQSIKLTEEPLLEKIGREEMN